MGRLATGCDLKMPVNRPHFSLSSLQGGGLDTALFGGKVKMQPLVERMVLVISA